MPKRRQTNLLKYQSDWDWFCYYTFRYQLTGSDEAMHQAVWFMLMMAIKENE